MERGGSGRHVRIVHTIMQQSHSARMLTLRLRPKPAASVAERGAIVPAIAEAGVDRAQVLPLIARYGMRHL